MSKVCKSCGEYYDGEYCPKCGYGNKDIKSKKVDRYKKSARANRRQQNSIYNNPEQRSAAVGKSNGKNLLVILVVIVAGIIVAGLIKSGVFSSGEKTDVIKDYFQAINERDFDDYVDCFSSEIKKELKNDLKETGLSEKEYMDKLVAGFEEDYGKGVIFSAVCGKQKLIDNYDTKEYKAAYGSVPSISEMYAVSVTLTVRGSDKTDEVHTEFNVGKVGFKWRLFDFEQVTKPEAVDENANQTKAAA